MIKNFSYWWLTSFVSYVFWFLISEAVPSVLSPNYLPYLSQPQITCNPVLYFHFRSVYESNNESDFLQKLNEHSVNHEKEIERMCNFHYQGFVESVNELIRVRSDANRLKVWDFMKLNHVIFFRLHCSKRNLSVQKILSWYLFNEYLKICTPSLFVIIFLILITRFAPLS